LTNCVQQESFKINWIGNGNYLSADYELVREDTRLYFEQFGLDIVTIIDTTPFSNRELWTFNYQNVPVPGNGLCPDSAAGGAVNDNPNVEKD